MATRARKNGGAAAGASASHVLLVGCGFVGRHLAAGLAEAGHRVSVLSRGEPPEDVVRAVRADDVHLGDAADSHTLGAALAGVRHVVWCAGGLLPPDAEQDPMADELLTLGPLRTLTACLDPATGTSVTYISSGGTVYGNPGTSLVSEDAPTRPISAYGRVRLAAERLLLESGLDVRVLRCANVYGEYQPADRSQGAVAVFMQRVRDGEEITLYGAGSTVRDFIYVGDVVAAAAELLGRRGPRILNVGSGRGVSIRELLNLIERTIGRRALVVEHGARAFEVDHVVLDVSRLRALVPFEPVALSAGLARTAAALAPAPSAALR